MTVAEIQTFIQTKIADFGFTIIGAIAIWAIGRWLITFSLGLVRKALNRQKIEPTLINYIVSTIAVLLNLVLIMAIFGYFGVQTTTFAALIAAAGFAIGAAWGGLLANFAAGVFLVILRPFKVGDFISAGGVIGTVEEVGMFASTINTPDNVKTIVGNNKIFGDNIQNFTANPYRRVELAAQISGATDPHEAIASLKARIAAIPNVCAEPAPDVVILSFTLVGPVLAVRPYCHNDHYWQVYFDTNMAIREVLGSGVFPAPMPAYAIRQI